jgi:hypothetical protein
MKTIRKSCHYRTRCWTEKAALLARERRFDLNNPRPSDKHALEAGHALLLTKLATKAFEKPSVCQITAVTQKTPRQALN